MQETNVGTPQFYRIRNHFVGCWSTKAPTQQQETVRGITNPNPNKRETEPKDMLNKGSFTRYEWEDLLRSWNIMNFSMSSCSHFLSNRKQSVMSKRGWESTSKEGSAVAKPRPMNLESRNLLNAKKDPPQDSSDPNSPGDEELDQSCVSSSGRKLTPIINKNPREATR